MSVELPRVLYEDSTTRVVARLDEEDDTIEVVVERKGLDALGQACWATMSPERNPRTGALERCALKLAGLNPDFGKKRAS